MKKLELNLTTILLSALIYQFPFLNTRISLNWINSLFIDLPIFLDLTDVINYLFTSLLLIIFYFISLYSKMYLKSHYNSNYFEIMFNIFFISMALLMSASNLITTIIAWELLSIISFLLISFYTLRIEASKSAFKALLMNKLGNITLLLATIHVYNLFATTNNKIINSIVYLLICDKLLAFIRISLIICAMTKCTQHIFSG